MPLATQNGGGEHGHVGMVVDKAEYVTFSKNGTRFLVPMNPGPYPTTVDPDKVIREQQIAEHKAECIEYKTYLGVENYTRRMIVKSINHKWLAEVESETMGFNHLSPKDLLTHLRSVGGTLDHMDVTELFTNIQKPWDGIEAPAAHFARGDKFERQLLKVGQSKNPELRLAFALATFHASGGIRTRPSRLGGKIQDGPDVCELPCLHSERVRKAAQAKQNHSQIGGARHC